jgi:hypothetical protein
MLHKKENNAVPTLLKEVQYYIKGRINLFSEYLKLCFKLKAFFKIFHIVFIKKSLPSFIFKNKESFYI